MCTETVISKVLDCVCLPPGGWQVEGHTVGDPSSLYNRTSDNKLRNDGIKLTNQNSLY